MMRWLAAVLALLCLNSVHAQSPLVVTNDQRVDTFTADQLLARRDARTLTIPRDIAYNRSMTYRAVPLLALLPGTGAGRFDTLEVTATDGFTAQIPLSLILRGAHGGAVAWLAIDDPAHPWPTLPGGKQSPGPYYIVWEHPEKSGVLSEQWPYAMARMTMVEGPLRRWPQLALPPAHAGDPALQAGQKAFLALCLPCHRLNGAGTANVGPDLGQPMNATQYLSEAGLRAIIRDPRAVRTWPGQQMSGFAPDTLSDADLNGLISYLRAMRR